MQRNVAKGLHFVYLKNKITIIFSIVVTFIQRQHHCHYHTNSYKETTWTGVGEVVYSTYICKHLANIHLHLYIQHMYSYLYYFHSYASLALNRYFSDLCVAIIQLFYLIFFCLHIYSSFFPLFVYLHLNMLLNKGFFIFVCV